MAAPTPVRALVHSSTLVTAGVYVLIRYCHSDLSVLLNIGAFTMLLAGLRACVESDLKKVVALRTLSQLGVMIICLGINEKSYCFFHLISHAYFKALLFICVGTHIHSIYGSQEYRRFNKLRPTLIVSVLATTSNLALIGFIFMSGFYRKDIILEAMYTEEVGAGFLAFFLMGITLTSCYSIKIILWTILFNSYSGTISAALGGYRWTVKFPLMLLGIFRLSYGTKVSEFCSALRLVIYASDKVLPIFLLLTGICLGYFLNRSKNALMSSMVTLVPTTQKTASFSINAGFIQKSNDNG